MQTYMEYAILFGMPIIAIAALSYLAVRKIRTLYREYDRLETLKEKLSNAKSKIRDAMKYFKDNYNSSYDNTVYHSLVIKIGYISELIEKLPTVENKLDYYDKLYERLYETGYRLKTNYEDVVGIMSPTSNLMVELGNIIKMNEKNGKL